MLKKVQVAIFLPKYINYVWKEEKYRETSKPFSFALLRSGSIHTTHVLFPFE